MFGVWFWRDPRLREGAGAGDELSSAMTGLMLAGQGATDRGFRGLT